MAAKLGGAEGAQKGSEEEVETTLDIMELILKPS